MASSVTEEDIAKLRATRYLTAEILHRLPSQGQVIPTPKIHREGRIHLPLPPGARVRSPSLRSWTHVLLRARFTRSSSGLLSSHLDVHRHVRGLSPYSPTLWLMAQDV